MSSVIDLSRLPAPDVVEVIDFEALLAERKAGLLALIPDDQRAAVSAKLQLESEPITILLQESVFREMYLRQRVIDAARATMLAFAQKGDLDQVAALLGVYRLTIDPGDPDNDIPPTMEEDEDLRYRAQLAVQGYSVAGPEGSYKSHARGAHGLVLDASATSPAPGEVLVTVLSRAGDGTPDQTVLDAVEAALNAEDVRPLTDKVSVRGASVVPYAVSARLVFFAGPDRSVALAAANIAMKKYTDSMHRLGMEVTLDGIYAAARVGGVQKVILNSPADDVQATKLQAPYCTGIELIDGGVYSNE